MPALKLNGCRLLLRVSQSHCVSIYLSIMSKNTSNRSNHDDGARRATRRSVSPLPPRRLTDDNGDTPAPKLGRASLRKFTAEINYCCDLKGINHSFKCAGCARWDESKKIKPRDEIKTREHQCLQVWKLQKVPKRFQKHYDSITGYIETAYRIHRAALVEEPPLPTTTTAATPSPPTTTTTTVTPAEPVIRMELNTFQSYGKKFEYWIPHTHKIVNASHNKRWENDSIQLAKVVHKLQSSCFTTNSVFSQTLFSLAMASAPALALSAAQHLIPLCFMAFIYDTELFRRININQFATSFPSDWLLRKYIHHQAARDTISMGMKSRGKRLYLSCDKGNKRGVSHFIKLLSSWKLTGGVDVQVLDIDGSGGTTLACALAIKASINKLKVNDDDQTHLIAGQSTDSGGGGVLEKLAEEMQALGLCWLHNHLIANCCMHGLQLQLSNGIKAAFGEGGLENINGMQMLHSVYRLQESIDLEEWRHILYLSSQFIVNFDPAQVPDPPPIVEEEEEEETAQEPTQKKKKKKKRSREEISASNKAEFMADLKKIYGFHSEFKKRNESDPSTLAKCEDTIFRKMIAPILTRWWTVGSGASYTFDYYLQLFHACQTVINIYPSGSTPNDIASDLFAMMKDQNNFIDMCLVRTFNKNYLNTHLDWFQSCKDLTDVNGFQSHQVAIRYHLMECDLRNMLSGDRSRDYFTALNRGNPSDKALHMKKLQVFGNAAQQSLYKHFDRWIKAPLLPAGLMAESPVANVIAAAICQQEPTHGILEDRITGKMSCTSPAHKRVVDLRHFRIFLRKRMELIVDDDDYTEDASTAAQLVLNQVDMRSFDYAGDVGTVRFNMHSTCLPLACQTQFVEAVVKEAKHVSQTDRSEQQRSCYAIIRSVTPLSKAEKNANVEKIKAVINSALDRAGEHVRLMRNQVNNEHNSWFATTAYSLARTGHFEMERIDAKIARVDDQGVKFKKQNVAQQTKQQQLQPAITGLIPCGKLTKVRNMLDLEEELLFRDLPLAEIPASITERKAKLKQIEFNRLVAVGMEAKTAAEQSKKYFMKLSEAPFKLRDD